MSSKTIGRVTIHPGRRRSKDQYMGRFGGGWQYKIGVTVGTWDKRRTRTILVALWTDEYRITIAPKAAS
jgi:hypothetical protein